MSDHLRLSDTEREAAAADLGEHYAQGRITPDEHAERLDLIWAARTRGEIAPIFRDLPSPFAPPQLRTWTPGKVHANPPYGPRPGHELGRRPGRGVPGPLLVGLVLLMVLTVFSNLPLILIGIVVWFVLSSNRRSRARSRWQR